MDNTNPIMNRKQKTVIAALLYMRRMKRRKHTGCIPFVSAGSSMGSTIALSWNFGWTVTCSSSISGCQGSCLTSCWHEWDPAFQSWTPVFGGQLVLLSGSLSVYGDSFRTIAFSYRVGHCTVCRVVREVAAAIWQVLGAEFMPAPSREDCLSVAEGFRERWNVPNCVGSIDGKHVIIQAPDSSCSLYFRVVDVGGYGRTSDGGTLYNSAFGEGLRDGTLDLPEDAAIRGAEQRRRMPLSRARLVVECAFGILSSQWRMYRRVIGASPATAEVCVKATCVLHNDLRVMTLRRKETSAGYRNGNQFESVLAQFEALLVVLAPHLRKQRTNSRVPMDPEQRLAVCLRSSQQVMQKRMGGTGRNMKRKRLWTIFCPPSHLFGGTVNHCRQCETATHCAVFAVLDRIGETIGVVLFPKTERKKACLQIYSFVYFHELFLRLLEYAFVLSCIGTIFYGRTRQRHHS
ncbi:hypothetical protein ACEWY4_010097 [Coilia grayii]|uniref:DDE Tnp4 domain-containing protein n=1 Tax=Coilia grayii TaxID=363190 RepID=A0ABD1K8A1_9TELE